ncbi:MAG: SIS domain-containing protein [Acidimicrobiia bacterium]|nr:SIS domain-containing protein [Acidimicrobiia bacterium]
MCGIIGVVRRRSTRVPPELAPLVADLDACVARVEGWAGSVDDLVVSATAVERVDAALRGVPGVRALLADRAGALAIEHRVDTITALLRAAEAALDSGDAGVVGADLEAVNAALLRGKDVAWAVRHDRLRNARAVGDLAGSDAGIAAIEALTSVQVALSALDRLEVRGRDSAGLHLLVRDHALDFTDGAVVGLMAGRAADPLFEDGAVRTPDGLLSVVYKAAAEIGELGDNVRRLRAAIRDDALLHLALANDTAEVVVLGHTRWASVGIISEPNAHPLNSEELGRNDGPYVVGALNGDVDNYADLTALESLAVPAEITTDAKVIPTLVSHHLGAGASPAESFRATVATLEGSVAIGASEAAAPDRLFLALRGSGQALYVGLAEDAFIAASEPYGLVEETSTYVRLDGETPADASRAGATRGQIAIIDTEHAGTVDGLDRVAYDGTPLPVGEGDLQHAQITTRDIDRGNFPHFLLKEISEAPASFRKTLRGKIVEDGDRLHVTLGPETFPDVVRARLASGEIRRVAVIGQGTAAVAGRSLAAILRVAVDGRVLVEPMLATELSGFALRDDMRDTLIVAVSQSGTTTDTNRTVDVARDRGAFVIAIVNRRNSDLVDKSDGVLFTSDGRDVEMSVASTKAFYAQIAAGTLLAVAIADAVGGLDAAWSYRLLAGLRELPAAMSELIDRRDEIAVVAQRHVLSRRYWAVVGNGVNAIAANEIRIKLSELCYKAIACDVTEDKKHIDLSSEPLIIVCAAGLVGSNADDVGKEVAIYRAHRAAPIVIANDATRYPAALETITVRAVHPELDFVLATAVGHLFGYEAALAIDASARPLREARAGVEAMAPGTPEGLLDRLAPAIEQPARTFFDGLRAGGYDGTLEASTAARLASLLRYATGGVSLDSYEVEHGKVGVPSTVVQDLTAALTKGIEELTRPVDAIKHQAKTVTVGISRSDETLLQAPLVREVLAAGAPRDGLSYRALRTLVDLDPAVVEVTGYTRYRIEGDLAAETATLHVVDKGGVAAGLVSRSESDPQLRGTKHRVATQREVTAVSGRSDGRTLVIVPEIKQNETVGLTLLHVRFADRLAPAVMRAVLQGYQSRYGALKDAVTETEPVFDDARLGTISVTELLTAPVNVLAERWRTVAGT